MQNNITRLSSLCLWSVPGLLMQCPEETLQYQIGSQLSQEIYQLGNNTTEDASQVKKYVGAVEHWMQVNGIYAGDRQT